jgi:hypothetical protein
MRITKAWLRTNKNRLEENLRDIMRDVFKGETADKFPSLTQMHETAFPHLSHGERPVFAAAQLMDLIQQEIDQAIPCHTVD